MAEIKLDPVKPEKALEYWKTRRPLSDQEKNELETGARDRSMAVAGLTRHNQLSAVYSALEKALDEGKTLADFKKEIQGLIEKQSWADWRVENIFRTNLASAYAAGAWAEIQATSEAFPYLEYLAVGDDRTRPSHAVLNGKIYPVDHEFWQRNYPPNGFGCRCTTAPVSRSRAERKGLTIETEMPQGLSYKGANGYPIHVAAPGADPGFTNNVGRDWLAGLTPNELGETLKFGPARTVCPVNGDFAAAGGACGLPLDKIDPKHILPVKSGDILPSGRSNDFYALEFLKSFGLNDLNGRTLVHILGGRLVLPINRDLLTDKTTGELKADKEGRGPYMRLLAETIKNPFEVWRVPATVSSRACDVLRLLRMFQVEGGPRMGGFSVFNWVPGVGWTGASAFTPKVNSSEKRIFEYLENQRQGNLIFREK